MSRTRLFAALKALDVPAVARLLDAQPDLLRAVDDRRRNALHFLCGLPADPKTAVRARALAGRLLDGGLDVNAPTFVEGASQATPLWYAIARGRNLPLARFLLKHASGPENGAASRAPSAC